MNNKTVQFLNTLKRALATKGFTKFLEKSDEDLIRFFFKNPTSDDPLGLTYVGCKILKQHFEHWEVKLTEELNARQRIKLLRHSQLPFYISSKTIVLFERELGSFLVLASGSANTTLESLMD